MNIIVPAWAVSIIVALIGILGIFAAHRYVAFKTASVKFRSAVLAELGSIYPDSYNWPKDIRIFLRAAFPNLQTAVVEFRYSIPWWRFLHRRAFDDAWHRFYGEGQNEQHLYYQYVEFGSNPNYKTIFHDNVSLLLSFAKET